LAQGAGHQGRLDAIGTAEGEIRQHLDAAGGQATAEHWVLYDGFITPDSEVPIEVCVPFTGVIEPAGNIAIRLEGAHGEVYATVLRDDCYYPLRGIYLAAWCDIAGTDSFVQIATPVEES
jgi:hypothetical protein